MAEARRVAMQDLMFTVLITCTGRALMFRDRLRRLRGKRASQVGSSTAATHFWIPSGANFVDALLVEPVGRPAKASVLICHGIGETVEHWRGAQALLAEHGVCSLVFDYSGYGRSSGRVDAAQWERDAMGAFCFLQRMRPTGGVSLLGYSLGSGVAASIAVRVPARRLMLCAAFASLRKAARRSGMPEFVTGWLPDIWDNEEALRRAEVPVLIVHGAEDRLFPVSVARELAEASNAPCELVVVPGVAHNGPIFGARGEAQRAFWGAVISGVGAGG